MMVKPGSTMCMQELSQLHSMFQMMEGILGKGSKALNDLPSSKTWRFPPRPWTNHVRWIEPDATNPNYLFVAIEAGALVHSRDGGKTWIDRVKDGPVPYSHSIYSSKSTQATLLFCRRRIFRKF